MFNLPLEFGVVCFEPTGEGNSFLFLGRYLKSGLPVLVGLQQASRFTDMGGPNADRVSNVGVVAGPPLQALTCGDDFDTFINDALANNTADDFNVTSVTLKVVRTGN